VGLGVPLLGRLPRDPCLGLSPRPVAAVNGWHSRESQKLAVSFLGTQLRKLLAPHVEQAPTCVGAHSPLTLGETRAAA